MTDKAAYSQRAESREQRAESLNNALVSIIIPAYNTEKYIYRAIESSIRQTYKNIEIIIIDDGSTDNTLKAAQKYNYDNRVRIFQQDNNGVSSARNYGIREAKGEYIIFLDSDDWLEDNAVEILLDLQVKYPDKFICAGKYNVDIDPKTGNFIRTRNIKTDEYDGKIFNSLESLKIILSSPHSKMYRSDIIRKYNLTFKEDIHIGEDQIFNFYYMRKMEGTFYTSQPLSNMFERQGSASRIDYNHSKIFVDGKFKDWQQVLIDNPDITPEMKKFLENYRAGEVIYRVYQSVLFGVNLDNFRKIVEKARSLIPEYMQNSKLGLKQKINCYLIMYLPVRLVKYFKEFTIAVKKLLAKLGLTKKVNNITSEIIQYW